MKLTKEKENVIDIRENDLIRELRDLEIEADNMIFGNAIAKIHTTVKKLKDLAKKGD